MREKKTTDSKGRVETQIRRAIERVSGSFLIGTGLYEEEDGVLYVYKTVSAGAFGLPVGGGTRRVRFWCMETDGDAFYQLALLGGLFGMHKFAARQYLAGLGYFLSFGMCGIFYLLDLIEILTGNYWHWEVTYIFGQGRDAERKKERIFCRPVNHLRVAVLSLPVAICMAFMGLVFIYLPLLKISSGLFLSFIDKII